MPTSLAMPAGMWMKGCQSRGPASSSRTRWFGSAERRCASTQPAGPAPTITKSYTGRWLEGTGEARGASLEQLLDRVADPDRAAPARDQDLAEGDARRRASILR